MGNAFEFVVSWSEDMDYGTRGCMAVVGGARGASKYGMESPGVHRRRNALTGTFLTTHDEDTGFRLRKDLFLGSCQNARRSGLHQTVHTYLFQLVSTKVPTMWLDRYRDPGRWTTTSRRLAGAVSVTPLQLSTSARFCSAIVEVIRDRSSVKTCVEGFEWSHGFMTRTFVRTIAGDPIIVLDAITTNGKSQCS